METDTQPVQEEGQREEPRHGPGSSNADRPNVAAAAATASGGAVGQTHGEGPKKSLSHTPLQDAAPAAGAAPKQAGGQQSGRKQRIQKPSTSEEPTDTEEQQESAQQYIADFMAKLREDVAAKGGPSLDGWRCEVSFRKTGQQKRPDPMYFSPSGRRCRSRIEVLKALGLVEGGSEPKSAAKSPKAPKPSKAWDGAPKKKEVSREDAMEHARHALEHLALPYKAASGVTITSLGSFDPRPAYRSRLHIFPVGLTAEFADPAAAKFTNMIRDGGPSGPDFVVLLSKDGGPPQEIASGKSPNAAWDQVAAQQAAAAARQQPASSKQDAGPSSGAQPAEPRGPPAAGSQEASQQAGNGSPAKPSSNTQPAAGIAASGATPAEKAVTEAGRVPAGEGPGWEAAAEPQPPLANSTTAGAASNAVAMPEAGAGNPAAGTEPSGMVAEPPGPEQTAAEAELPRQPGQAKEAPEAGSGAAAGLPGLSSQAAVACLVDAVPIDSKPSIERFALNSEPVLKAIEGLPGVSECEGYVYVEEQRQWSSHMTLIRKEYKPPTTADEEAGKEARKSASKSKKTKVDDDQPTITDFLNGAGPSSKQSGSKRKRDSGPETKAKSSKQKTAKSFVQDVVENLIHNVEVAEGKQARQRDRDEKRQAQQAERAAKKAAEKAEKERQRRVAAEAEQQRRMEEAEQRRRALAEGGEDSELPGAEAPPLAAKAVPGTAQLLPADLPGVLEVWEFLGRFSGVLQLAEVPSLSELATAVANPGPDSRDPFNSVMAALTDVVASEAFDAALNVALDANDDIKPRETEAAAPAVQDWSWPEVARRLFCLTAVGNLVQASHDGSLSGGLDVALGPLMGSSPLGTLGPGLINQGLVAGSLPANPGFTAAALPVGACTTAAAAVNARIDAAALKAAEHRLGSKTSGGAAAPNAETVTMCRLLLRHLRAVKGPKDANGLISRPTILFFDGDKAAIAAKQARPLDLHTISVRNDSGLYACMEDGIKAFAADLHYVCDLFQAASKNKKSDFARTLLEKRAPQVADLARVMLTQLLPAAEEGSLQAPNGKTGKRSKAPSREASAELQGEETGQPTAAQDDEDLAQPLKIGEGCCACWGDDDRGRLLICDGCEEEYHTYCLDPPLPQLPTNSEEWFCPVCQAEEEGRPPEPLFRHSFGQHRVADTGDAYSAAATLLGAKEYADLSPTERVSVAVAVAALAEGCATVRDHLIEDETQKKDLRKELIELRAKVKRDTTEREEREKAEKESAKPSSKSRGGDAPNGDLPRPRTRAEEAAEAESAADRVRIQEILGQLQMQANGTRREAIGYDRHWNRYWILGSFGPDEPGTLFVELSGQKVSAEAVESKPGPAEAAAAGSSRAPVTASGVPEWGCYPDARSMDELLSYLNPKGKRERALQKVVQKHRNQLGRAGPSRIGNGDMPAGEAPVGNGRLPEAAAGPATEGGEPVAAAKPAAAGALGDEAMPDASLAAVGLPPQREEEPRPTAAMVIDASQPDHDTEIEAAGNGAAVDSEAAEASEFDSLRSSLLAFVEGMDIEALEPARGSVARLRQWRSLVDAATEPQDLMAGLMLAEGFLPAARLKPWWRLWTFPAPLVSMGGLTAVRLRLSALQSAIKKGPVAAFRGGQGATAVAVDSAAGNGAAGRYPLRERRATKGALAEAMLMRNLGNTTSEDDEPDDEALARAIHSSLNGNPRDVRAALRTRARPAPQESNGMRNTRAAAKMGNFPERQLPETRSTRSRLAGDPFRALVNGSSRSNSAEPMGPSSSEDEDEAGDEDEQPLETSDTAAEDGLQEEAGGEPSEQQQTVAVAGRKRLRKATD